MSSVERPENNPIGIGLIMCAIPNAQHDVEDLFLVCGYCAEANGWLPPGGLRLVPADQKWVRRAPSLAVLRVDGCSGMTTDH